MFYLDQLREEKKNVIGLMLNNMKQILLILCMLLLISCGNNKTQNDFINYTI